MCKKIFFGNYKGGVGKTTSTYNIAVEMAKNFDKKVLLIDLDPQSSLSEVCMNSYHGQLDDLTDAPESLNYVYDINMQARKVGNLKIKVDVKKIIKRTNGISFIPNSLFYKNGGLDKISMDIGTSVENLLILRDFIEDILTIEDIEYKYDFIFFDCPPSNNVITQSAFLYSDYFIIPTIMDPLSVKGVRHYVSVIMKVYDRYCGDENPNSDIFKLVFGDSPELIGVFETMRKGNTDTTNHRNAIKGLGFHLLTTEIKDRKDVSVTIGSGNATNSYEYLQLTEEILDRIKAMEASK